ncbi:MAG: gamma-glutamyltransferase [candidate division Zixibacteria bacterium]|nr:gamma-glutamyltransferase [candidate division Zixibacteria bacterium]
MFRVSQLRNAMWPAVVGVCLALIIVSCDALQTTHLFERGAVASSSPTASAIGVDVFRRGGNAFDAAVAVGFALAVTHPQAGNLGGGGFAVVYSADSGRVEALDFRERAPLAATADMYLNDSGEVVDRLSTYGALASGVPGTVAGLYEMWKLHGTLPWEDLVGIAAALADTGFVVDELLAADLAENARDMTGFTSTAAAYYPGGNAPVAGESLVLKDLGTTLYSIAAEGPDAFYTGTIADRIVTCMQQHGGIITAEDLAAYRPVWRDPIHFSFDSLDVYTMSPPSSGGIVVGQILKLLEPYDFSTYRPESPEYIHLFCEASRLAFADRAEHLGDPDFWPVPDSLLSGNYLAGRRDLISRNAAGTSSSVKAGNPGARESEETTHFSVCDADGNMVAITTTLNGSFGNMLVVDSAGFLLNNEMDDFSIKAGYANLYGLVGGEANKIEPGKRMLSSMAPTLVFREGRPYLNLGSPGGSKIITTVAQAVINFTRFGLSAEETVARPRFHHQWLPDMLYMERDDYTFDITVKQALIRFGHGIEERHPWGDLQIIHVDPSGLLTGASDPRRGGACLGY